MRIRKYGKIAVFVASMLTAITMLSPVAALAEADAPYVSLGADLTAEQKATVLELLDVKESEINEDTTVTVTNADEHRYLDGVLSDSAIGTKALSCCKVIKKNEGYGIKVETHNVTSITAEMFQNALATAGMKNAYVVVAAPTPISGTAALVGAMQAYAKMNGHAVQTDMIVSAARELVTSDRIAALTGDPSKVTQLMAAVKKVVVSGDVKTEADMRNAITDIAAQMNIGLSDAEVDEVMSIMKTVSTLDLDPNEVSAQVKSIYDAAVHSGLDLSSYGISDATVNSVLDNLPSIIRIILSWLRGIFGTAG